MTISRFLVIAAWLLVAATASAQTPAGAYRVAAEWGYRASVAKVAGTRVEIAELGWYDAFEEGPVEDDPGWSDVDIVEGYYLAFVGPAKASTKTYAGWRVARVRLIEVTSPKTAVLEVGPAAAKLMKIGWQLRLHRPLGATTKSMQAVPEIATISDETQPLPGLDRKTADAYLTAEGRLKQIGLALHNYHDAYDAMPPAAVYGPDGKPWHSWRVLILPYLGQRELFRRYRFDEPWDGPNNKKLIADVPEFFRDPIHGESEDGYTHFAAVVGRETVLTDRQSRFPAGAGVKGWPLSSITPTGARIRDVTDGTVNTIMVGPVAPQRKIPWTKPEEVGYAVPFPKLGQPKGFAAAYTRLDGGSGGLFLFTDGSVRSLDASSSSRDLQFLCNRGDGEFVDLTPFTARRDEFDWESNVIVTFASKDDGSIATFRTVYRKIE